VTDKNIVSSRWELKPSTIGRLLVILIVGIPSIGFIFKFQLQNRALSEKLAVVREEAQATADRLAETNETRRKLDQSAKTYKLQKQRILSILRSCRQAEDLWENDSLLCVSALTRSGATNETSRLLLPSGNHELVVRIEKIDAKSKEKLTEKELRYPLPAGGYFVELDMPREKDAKYRDPRDLFLRITSSNPSYRSIEEKPLEHRIRRFSSFRSGSRPNIFFPNQVDNFGNVAEAGVLFNAMNRRLGSREQQTFVLKFEMRLQSDSPPVVNSLKMRRPWSAKRELKYLGDGRYEILQPSEE